MYDVHYTVHVQKMPTVCGETVSEMTYNVSSGTLNSTIPIPCGEVVACVVSRSYVMLVARASLFICAVVWSGFRDIARCSC